jgi:hypothetical protein
MGRTFFLINGEADKVLFSREAGSVSLGPFLDTGKVYDSRGEFGSQKWLVDTGFQIKLRSKYSPAIALVYGFDLRGGKKSFSMRILR